jgi:hypothetical protein
MFKLGISGHTRAARRKNQARRGSALVGTVTVLVGLLGVLYVASAMSVTEVRDSRRAVDDVRTRYLADSGVECGINFLSQAVKNNPQNPLKGLTNLFIAGPMTLFVGQPVMNGTEKVGSYSVAMSTVQQTGSSITVAIDSTGYLPDAPANLPAGKHPSSWHSVRTTVKYTLAPSQVFDYAYFINNWGWFYGDTIYANGNVRSNGQFDAAGYAPTVTGQPTYDSVAWDGAHATLSGYHDDNHDGLQDGKDGGVFSGWDIINVQHLQGQGASPANQHDFQPQVPMPNLTDLTYYETNAITSGGNITIGGVTVTNAVYGDEAGEKQNLYLVGTAANPITLHGPVVVRGNLIISGYVTGQGAIYSGGNVYCPDSVKYVNPPSSPRPANNSQSATETWLSDNWNKDFLGLFARKSVALGDFTDGTWQYYESWWMSDPMNASNEDQGSDGIPNTHAGKDGIVGTADDDVLENDGVFTIQHYSAQDQALGLIPPGAHVGDPIPGTGEDIDGNGVYDGSMTLANIINPPALNTTNWGGNMPVGGIANYHDVASMTANHMDAVFYTNHSFCYTVLGGQPATINGALVSRNEDIIYGTPNVQFNYDCRLLGGSSGMASKFLPTTMQPVQVVRWAPLDHDPNKSLVHP